MTLPDTGWCAPRAACLPDVSLKRPLSKEPAMFESTTVEEVKEPLGAVLTAQRRGALTEQLLRLNSLARTIEHDYPDILAEGDRELLDMLRQCSAVVERSSLSKRRVTARHVARATV